MLTPSDPIGPSGSSGGEFRLLREETVFEGSLITVGAAQFEAPDGTRFDRELVHHPGAVVVVPVTSEGRVVMVRQFRAAIGRDLLEVPAGKRDVEGEPTETTAERELMEEVGRRAGSMELIACFYNSPGFCDEYTWLYLARDLAAIPHDPQGAEERHMVIEEVSLDDVPRLIAAFEIVDAKTIIGLCLARERLTPPYTA
ncbi:MAG: NUDIX hydrolase [Acidimicrobiales bacterium]|nr:NUDIX hydrolase [Acidimicrobiales bacterium]